MRKSKEKMYFYYKNDLKNHSTNNGITLIALVVTIIVLLILAGISIQMLTGQTGILRQTQEASEDTKIAEYDELIKLAETKASMEKQGSATLGKVIEEIYKEKIVPEGYIIETGEGKAEVYTPEGYIFEITGDTVEYVGKVENDEIEKMKKSNYMIKKGDKREYYEKLLEAYNSVDAGEIIIVLKDVEETETIKTKHDVNNTSILNIEKDIIIDTNTKILKIGAPIFVYSGTLHLKGNGEIYCNADRASIQSRGGNIETSGNPTIKGLGVGLQMVEGDGTLTLNGGYVIGEGRGGIQTWGSGDILINNTTVLGLPRTKNGITIYEGATCDVTIEGNSIIGNGVINEPGIGDTISSNLVGVISNHTTGTLTLKGNSVITTRFSAAPISMYDNTKLKVLDNASIYCCEVPNPHAAVALADKSNIKIEIDTTGILGSMGSGNGYIFSGLSGDNNELEVKKGKFAIGTYKENIFGNLAKLEVPESKLAEERDVTYYYVNSENYNLEPMVMHNYYYSEY